MSSQAIRLLAGRLADLPTLASKSVCQWIMINHREGEMRLNVSEIARKLGVPRSTVQAGLRVLCAAGICEKCGSRYELRVTIFDTLEPVDKTPEIVDMVERDATPSGALHNCGVERDAPGGCSVTLQKVECHATPFNRRNRKKGGDQNEPPVDNSAKGHELTGPREPPAACADYLQEVLQREGRARGHAPSVFS